MAKMDLIDYTLTAEEARSHKNSVFFDQEDAEARLNNNFKGVVDAIQESGEKVRTHRIAIKNNEHEELKHLSAVVCPISWHKIGRVFREDLDEEKVEKFFHNNGLRAFILKSLLEKGFKLKLVYKVEKRSELLSAYYIISW